MGEKIITIRMTHSKFVELLDKLRFIRDEILEKTRKEITSMIDNLEQQARDSHTHG